MDGHNTAEKIFLHHVEMMDRFDREHKETMQRMKIDLSIYFKNLTPFQQVEHDLLKKAAESLCPERT